MTKSQPPPNMELGLVVEGHGEVEAVPILVRRLGLERDVPVYISAPTPVRVPRGKLLNVPGELERAIELAGPTSSRGALLVLIDADEDCPAQLGPDLLARVERVAGGRFPVAVVLAKTEYEAWFLASAESLRGERGLRDDLLPPAAPEDIGAAKAWLTQHNNGPSSYRETLDQPALTSLFDMAAARERSPSFDKFCRELDRLLKLTNAITEKP